MSFGYCGKTYDNGTGLYNYGFRDYSPNQARFTTVDPIRDGANWFAYVVNDPVNYIDPFGLTPTDVENYTYQGERDGRRYYTANKEATMWGLANDTGTDLGDVQGYDGDPHKMPIGTELSIPAPSSGTTPTESTQAVATPNLDLTPIGNYYPSIGSNIPVQLSTIDLMTYMIDNPSMTQAEAWSYTQGIAAQQANDLFTSLGEYTCEKIYGGVKYVFSPRFMADYGGTISLICYATGHAEVGFVIDQITLFCDLTLAVNDYKLSNKSSKDKAKLYVDITTTLVTAGISKPLSDKIKAMGSLGQEEFMTKLSNSLTNVICTYIDSGIDGMF
jgi:RHS repeat-associated protein